MPIHILVFTLSVGVVIGSLVLAVAAWLSKKRKLALITGAVPLFLITVTVFHLNKDAGKLRTDQIQILAQEYPSFAEEVGYMKDGLSMYEYWLSKDLEGGGK